MSATTQLSYARRHRLPLAAVAALAVTAAVSTFLLAGGAAHATQGLGSDPVFLVRNDATADATVAGPVAARAGGPVLYTAPDQLPQSTIAALAQYHPSTLVIVGGTQAISAQVQDQLTKLGYNVTRAGGADRNETAADLAGLLTSLPAAQGAPGPAGPPGPTGLTGAQGPAGSSPTPEFASIYDPFGQNTMPGLAVAFPATGPTGGGATTTNTGVTVATTGVYMVSFYAISWLSASPGGGPTFSIEVNGTFSPATSFPQNSYTAQATVLMHLDAGDTVTVVNTGWTGVIDSATPGTPGQVDAYLQVVKIG